MQDYLCLTLTTRLNFNKSISGQVLIIGKRFMIISMAIHTGQSIRSISLTSPTIFKSIHTYYMHLSQFDKSSIFKQSDWKVNTVLDYLSSFIH